MCKCTNSGLIGRSRKRMIAAAAITHTVESGVQILQLFGGECFRRVRLAANHQFRRHDGKFDVDGRSAHSRRQAASQTTTRVYRRSVLYGVQTNLATAQTNSLTHSAASGLSGEHCACGATRYAMWLWCVTTPTSPTHDISLRRRRRPRWASTGHSCLISSVPLP